MVVVASGTTVSVAANTKSADQITNPTFQITGKGIYRLYARASATGLNATFSNAGISPFNDLALPFFGTTGALSKNDHLVVEQVMMGGRNELTFRNTTGGALTVDYLLTFDPIK